MDCGRSLIKRNYLYVSGGLRPHMWRAKGFFKPIVRSHSHDHDILPYHKPCIVLKNDIFPLNKSTKNVVEHLKNQNKTHKYNIIDSPARYVEKFHISLPLGVWRVYKHPPHIPTNNNTKTDLVDSETLISISSIPSISFAQCTQPSFLLILD